MPNFLRPFLIKKTLSKKTKIFLIVCLTFAVFVVLFFSFFPLFNIFLKQSPQNPCFFAVMLDSKQESKTKASEQAQSFKARGGAGVLFFDKTFFLIMSAYKNENDAKTVAKSLSSENQSFVVKKFELNFNQESENQKVYQNFVQNLIENLYDLSVWLDDGTLTPVLANQKLRNYLTKTTLMYEDALKNAEFDFFAELLLNAKSILEYATSTEILNTSLLPFSSVVRQTQVQILLYASKNS